MSPARDTVFGNWALGALSVIVTVSGSVTVMSLTASRPVNDGDRLAGSLLAVPVGLDGRGVVGRAVGERDAVLDLQRPDREVGVGLERLGQHRLGLARLGVVGDERAVQGERTLGLRASGSGEPDRVERTDLAEQQDRPLAALDRLAGIVWRSRGRRRWSRRARPWSRRCRGRRVRCGRGLGVVASAAAVVGAAAVVSDESLSSPPHDAASRTSDAAATAAPKRRRRRLLAERMCMYSP